MAPGGAPLPLSSPLLDASASVTPTSTSSSGSTLPTFGRQIAGIHPRAPSKCPPGRLPFEAGAGILGIISSWSQPRVVTNMRAVTSMPSASSAVPRWTARGARRPRGGASPPTGPPRAPSAPPPRRRAVPAPIRVTWTGGGRRGGSGTGATLGAGAGADARVTLPGVADAHVKLEVKQGRVFVTALKGGGRVTLGDSSLFPGVAYAVKEGATIGLGEEGSEVTVEQVDGGAGTAGIDMMSKMMQMQFEATLKPEIKKALSEDRGATTRDRNRRAGRYPLYVEMRLRTFRRLLEIKPASVAALGPRAKPGARLLFATAAASPSGPPPPPSPPRRSAFDSKSSRSPASSVTAARLRCRDELVRVQTHPVRRPSTLVLVEEPPRRSSSRRAARWQRSRERQRQRIRGGSRMYHPPRDRDDPPLAPARPFPVTASTTDLCSASIDPPPGRVSIAAATAAAAASSSVLPPPPPRGSADPSSPSYARTSSISGSPRARGDAPRSSRSIRHRTRCPRAFAWILAAARCSPPDKRRFAATEFAGPNVPVRASTGLDTSEACHRSHPYRPR